MFRSTALSFTLALVIAQIAQAQGGAPGNAAPIAFPTGQGEVQLRAAVVGPDLSLTYEFENPVGSYLTADEPNFSLDLSIDTDNNAKTGFSQSDDPRRGSEYNVIITFRHPGTGKDDVVVSRYPKLGGVQKVIATAATVGVAGNKATVRIPLASMGLKKGQQVRFVPAGQGMNVTVEKTITLQ